VEAHGMRLISRRVDQVIVKEVRVTYAKLPVKPGDVALDLGANIGAASRLMLDKGVAKIIAVEADPTNYRLARRNLAKRPVTLIWAAVGAVNGRTTIWIRPDKPYLSSKLRDDGRVPVKVPSITLGGLLAQYRPSIIKCDIEFGEYDLPELHALPDFVKVLALELHVRHDLVLAHGNQTKEQLKVQRRETAALIASIEGQGFKSVWRKDKQAQTGAVEDDSGLGPLVKSVDAIWSR
jgi:FkbM family methyltransferase